MLLNEYEQDRSVIFGFLPDFPGLENAVAIVLDRGVRLHFRIDRYDNLAGGSPLKILQSFIQLAGSGGRNNAGVIIKIMCRRRRNDFRTLSGSAYQKED